ncbi:MAG: sugar phosphate isomerase/epimerase family protein [Nanobdellota archaeon]
MRLGFSGHLTPGTLQEDIDFALKHGFAYELSFHHREDFNRDLSYLQRSNLTISLHVPYYLPSATQLPQLHAANLRIIEQALTIGRQCDAQKMVIHGGYRENPDNQLNQHCLIENLREVIALAKRYNITVCLENYHSLPNLMCNDARELLHVLQSVPGLKATFDIGHANTVGDPYEFLRVIEPYVSHMHLHDNDGTEDAHVPLGEGNIGFQGLEYAGTAILELRTYEAILNAREYIEKRCRTPLTG